MHCEGRKGLTANILQKSICLKLAVVSDIVNPISQSGWLQSDTDKQNIKIVEWSAYFIPWAVFYKKKVIWVGAKARRFHEAV